MSPVAAAGCPFPLVLAWAVPTDVLFLLLLALAWPALKAAWFALFWLVARFERVFVSPLAPESEGFARPPTAYAAEMNRLARKMGLVPLGTFRHPKGGIYRVRSDLWAAPDGEFLAIVYGGTILGLPSYGTRLFSGLDDGRVVMTVDTFHSLGYFADGLVEGGLLLNADLFELVEHHRRLVAEAGSEVVPFDPKDPVADLADLRGSLIDRLVEDGFATYLDEDRTVYRYTNRGALRRATVGQRRSREVAFTNRDRFNVPRVGDPRRRPPGGRVEGPQGP